MLQTFLAKVIGTQNERDLKKLRPVVTQVNALESSIRPLSDDALRGKLGARTWRKLHYGSFALYVLATAHGIAAGTDTGRLFSTTVYAISIVSVTLLIGARALQPRGARRSRA